MWTVGFFHCETPSTSTVALWESWKIRGARMKEKNQNLETIAILNIGAKFKVQ